MKSKKRIITGQRLSILFIILALIVATLVTLVIMNFISKTKSATNEQYEELSQLFEEEVDIVAACERNSWGSDIIGSATKDDVPIPFGYEYKKGDLKTGTIIRETATGAELLWIPYQEDTSNYDISEYYKNTEDEEIDSDAVKSISKYNGFYVYLNMNMDIEELKDVSNENYKNYARQLSSTGEFGDTHILTKEEIQQILAYTNKNNIKLNSGVQAMTIGLYSTLVVSDEEVVSINKEGEVASTENVGLQLAKNAEYPYVKRTKSGKTYTYKYFKEAGQYYAYNLEDDIVYYKGYNATNYTETIYGLVEEVVFTDGYIVYATKKGEVYAFPLGRPEKFKKIKIGEDFKSFEEDEGREYFATGYNTTDDDFVDFKDELDNEHEEDEYPKVTKSGTTYKYYKKSNTSYTYSLSSSTLYYKGTNGTSSTKISSDVEKIAFTDGYIVYATEDEEVYALPIGKTGKSNLIEIGENFESFEEDEDREYFVIGYNTTDDDFIDFEDELNIEDDDNDADAYYAMVNDIPVPSGFKYNYTNKVMTIKSIENPNLVYVWVPATKEDLKNAKKEVKELYETYTDSNGDGIDLAYKLFDETEEDLDKEFLKSIEKFEGFYVSEAEMGYDSNNKFYNRARGMIGYSATNQIDGGDYFRGSSTNGSFNMSFVNSKARESCDEESVVSHLMYGAEYDRTLLWIYATNKSNQMQSNIVFDSTDIGKYRNSGENREGLGANSTATQSSKFLNGIWGLAGNLSELTQEKDDNGNYIVRGGDWSETGENAPMASRKSSELKDGNITKSDKIGFRTCLYINPDKSVKEKSKKQIEEFEEKEETINNITFEKVNNPRSLYTKNWDGAKVYSNPNQGVEAIDNLGFATRFVVNSVAKNMTTKDIWWGKGTVNGTGQEVFINIIDLTQSVVIENVDFVRGSSVTRYCDKNTMIYGLPSLQNGSAVGTEKVEVVGKSVNGQWAILVKDGREYFVESKNLRVAHTEQINGVIFDVLDEAEVKYNKNWEGLKAYSTPDLSGEAKHTYEFADNATVLAKAQNKTNDGILVAKVSTYLGDLFINYNDLIDPEYIGEVPVIKSTAVEKYYSGLTIFDAPNANATSNKVEYGGAIQVIGKSVDKQWIVVSLESDKYVKTEEILDLPIVFKDAVTKYYHNGLTLYDNVKDGKTTKLEGDGSVSVVGTSIMDPSYSVIEKDGYKYVKTSDLLDEAYKEPAPAPAPAPEPEPEPEPDKEEDKKEDKFTNRVNTTMYVKNINGTKYYESPDTNSKTWGSCIFGYGIYIQSSGTVNGKLWYKIKTDQGSERYVPGSDMISGSKLVTVNKYQFIMFSTPIETTCCKSNFGIYSSLPPKAGNWVTAYVIAKGKKVKVLGMDIGSKYAKIKIDDYTAYVGTDVIGKGNGTLKSGIDTSKVRKLQINNIELLYTRTENGDIIINNLSSEKIIEKDYYIKVDYKE